MEYQTRRPANPIFCHQDFLEKMEARRNDPVGKRAALLLHRLIVDERRQFYKATQGANRGWRRSRLGGTGGSHFYAWWAPRGAVPLSGLPEFAGAPENTIFLRDIRHHDDHSELLPQSLADNYLPVTVADLRQEDFVPSPWTPVQQKFAGARQAVRIVKGYPGSGKTTALWNAADRLGLDAVLYVTYSRELAALARDHFDKFAPAEKRFQVITFSELVRQILRVSPPFEPVHQARIRFVKEATGMSPRFLGPWGEYKAALYDEMHAHLVGSAIPFAIGRFPASVGGHLADRAYRDLRERNLGRPAAEAVLEVARTLRQRDSRSLEERFFPELQLAWNAVDLLRDENAAKLSSLKLDGFDCIAIDEAQDLTPLEAMVLVRLAVLNHKSRGGQMQLLAAGDEAQTVRPTDFEWGWFHDLLHAQLASPTEFKLPANVRSPQRIGTVVNRTSELYGHLDKSDRPSGISQAAVDEDAGDQVLFCTAQPGEELDNLLNVLAGREGLALISPSEDIPAWVPASLRDVVLTAYEAKGLDFHSVCVLDAGKSLERATRMDSRQAVSLDTLSRRLTIDQLRVAISRPNERLLWLDVKPSDRGVESVGRCLAYMGPAVPLVPDALLKTLEEDALDVEERIRLCQLDARQFLPVKPALAVSRARQAVNLSTMGGNGMGEAARSAQRTFIEIAFCVAIRRLPLPTELGRVDLYREADLTAQVIGSSRLAEVIRLTGELQRTYTQEKLQPLVRLAESIAEHGPTLEPWMKLELAPFARQWAEELEAAAGDLLVHSFLPRFYSFFEFPDAAERLVRIRRKIFRGFVADRLYSAALDIAKLLPDVDPAQVAACHEGLGDYEKAADIYLGAGDRKEAIRCYRTAPNFEKTLELISGMGDHPAAESLLWLKKMRDLAAARPAEFKKVMLPAEKKFLEQTLEQALGISRKEKAPAKKKAAVKVPKAVVKPVKIPAKPRRNEFF